MGTQADMILFIHNDHCGFDSMNAEHDEQYLKYAAARLSTYQNVWWTMANEYDPFDASLRKANDHQRTGTILGER
ncbi:hypothetical protein ACPOL_6984 (plasmid) [Acidisarcina polymorpha]|uniref:DUF4038 domain-containing protein n=1 Tax=Acidisarcina polymorpha TaxID=2211140 RepID=A0A2Z5GB20_9BACT|nr:hypothetical protein ACPOL_6984 [Acidisarcina polymorpha]